MRSELIDAGWTEEHMNRITGAVMEEVQRARVGAQILPTFGPADESAVSFEDYRLNYPAIVPAAIPPNRITTADTPDHPLTSIAVPVQLTSADVHDPDLGAALTKFRRAANILARLEDAVVFNDRLLAGRPAGGVAGIPPVDAVTGGGPYPGNPAELGLLPLDLGLANPPAPATPVFPRQGLPVGAPGAGYPMVPTAAVGVDVANAVVEALTLLENAGFSRPFACALSPYFYQAVYVPNANLIEAKDTILPILNGPLVRSSAIRDMTFGVVPPARIPYGVVVALGGDLVGIRVAVDVKVRFVQTTEEPRYVFRVSERIGLRISDPQAIVVLTP